MEIVVVDRMINFGLSKEGFLSLGKILLEKTLDPFFILCYIGSVGGRIVLKDGV